MRHWVKLHTKILNSPDLDGLTDHQYRACMKVFALGGVIDCDGKLGTTREVAYHLRFTETDTDECLRAMQEIDIVTESKGVWHLINWDKYQSHSPSSENDAVRARVKKHRENKPNVTVGNAVTPSLHVEGNDTRLDKNREEEIREETSIGASAPETPAPKVDVPLSPGQKLFTERWNAKRLNSEQKTAILALETQYGIERLTECVVWAREKNFPLGQSIGSIRTAIKKWGQPKPTGSNGHFQERTNGNLGRDNPTSRRPLEQLSQADQIARKLSGSG